MGYVFVLFLFAIGLSIPVYAQEKVVTEIISIDPISPQKWNVIWDACAITDITPFFRLSSDIDWELYRITFGTKLYGGECLSDILGHFIFTIVKAEDPDTIKIELAQYAQASDEPQVFILELIDSKFPDRYGVFFRICAGNEKLTSPQVVIFSDIEEVPTAISMTVLNPKSCVEHDVTIRANDKKTIDVQFVSFVDKSKNNSEGEVALLEEQLAEKDQQILDLKEEVDKKQAVIMEQLKVISNLASLIKKTIFEPILNYFLV